jgi:hypothetical protein
MKYRLNLAVLLAALGLGTTFLACSSSAPPAAPPAAAGTTSQQPALWGDMKPIVSVKELMHDMIDPASDFVFDAVSDQVTKSGTVHHLPKTDEDWDKIRFGAVTMAEGVYLLKVPRPFAPAGDENNSTGPDAEELSPAAITAKVKADPVQWNARIEALRNVGLQVLDIVKNKDVNQLWDASDNLDTACENCHVDYWYPNEGALFKKLDKRLLDMYGPDLLKASRGAAPR